MHWLVVALDVRGNILDSRWAWDADDARNILIMFYQDRHVTDVVSRDMRTI